MGGSGSFLFLFCTFASIFSYNLTQFTIYYKHFKFKKRNEYLKPTIDIVKLKQQQQLLAGSAPNSATIDNYEDGDFSW